MVKTERIIPKTTVYCGIIIRSLIFGRSFVWGLCKIMNRLKWNLAHRSRCKNTLLFSSYMLKSLLRGNICIGARSNNGAILASFNKLRPCNKIIIWVKFPTESFKNATWTLHKSFTWSTSQTSRQTDGPTHLWCCRV